MSRVQLKMAQDRTDMDSLREEMDGKLRKLTMQMSNVKNVV